MSLGADRHGWAAYLRAAGEPALAGTPVATRAPGADAWIRAFADEQGNRRRTDGPLLARLCGARPGDEPARLDPEERLWWGHAPGSIPELRLSGEGPLLAHPAGVAIEPMTEAELAALHALWCRRGEDQAIAERCLAAARWHVGELQPDNATGLPWAAHVFVELAMASPDPGERSAALFHAEGLVHASSLTLGRPGIRAACLLLDAARELGG